MSQATIDHYRDEISAALRLGDVTRIAEIAECFYHRRDYWMPWELKAAEVENNLCDGVRANLRIVFRDGSESILTVGHHAGKRLVCLKGENVYAGSMDAVVDRLGVPISFIDGMFVFACMVAKDEVSTREHLTEQSKKLFHWVDALKSQIEQLKCEKEKAESQISMLRASRKTRRICLPDAAGAMPKVPAENPRSINEAKKILAGVSGLYFAWCLLTGECVYVGKSKNMGSRISASREELDSCRITWLEMDPIEIHFAELFYIWLLKPARNGQAAETRRELVTG